MGARKFLEFTIEMGDQGVVPILIDIKSVQAVYPYKNGKAAIQLSMDTRYLIQQQYEAVKQKVLQHNQED